MCNEIKKVQNNKMCKKTIRCAKDNRMCKRQQDVQKGCAKKTIIIRCAKNNKMYKKEKQCTGT